MKDGGAAFPEHKMIHDKKTGEFLALSCGGGMTLRDYFAGQALIAFAHDYLEQKSRINRADLIIAENAYKLADAMLTEKEKK